MVVKAIDPGIALRLALETMVAMAKMAPMTEAHPNLQAWRDRMSARPPVRQVAGAMGRYLLSQGRKLPAFLAKLSA